MSARIRLTHILGNIFASIVAHVIVAGIVAFFVVTESAQVKGGPGLSGATTAAYDVTLAPVESRPAPKVAVLPKVIEGVEISDRVTELPEEVKNPKPVEIDTPPPSTTEIRSAGSTAGAAPGRVGQVGSSDQRADQIGNSERSNAYGLYLQKLHRRIQSQIESPGFLAYDQRATLRISIRRNGSVEKIEVVQSSGDAALDRRAIQAVQRAQPFDPWEKEQLVNIPVIFNAS